jgi:hypothetical protein
VPSRGAAEASFEVKVAVFDLVDQRSTKVRPLAIAQQEVNHGLDSSGMLYFVTKLPVCLPFSIMLLTAWR